jgi:hypothetical protein
MCKGRGRTFSFGLTEGLQWQTELDERLEDRWCMFECWNGAGRRIKHCCLSGDRKPSVISNLHAGGWRGASSAYVAVCRSPKLPEFSSFA